MATTIKEIRQKYPDYDDLSDQELADKLHAKFYNDMPKEDFHNKIGLSSGSDQSNVPSVTNTGMFDPANQTPTGSYVPQGTYEQPYARAASQTLASLMVPYYRAASLAPKAGAITKALLNYGGAIGQNAGISAALGALSPEQSATGNAKLAGATTAATYPLLSLASKTANPLIKLPISAGIGALAGMGIGSQTGINPSIADVAGGAIGALLGMKGAAYKNLAISKVLGNLTPEQKANALSKLSASRDVGVPLTAGEAIDTPIAQSQLSSLQETPESAMKLFDFSNKRLPVEKKSISDLLSKISPDQAYAQIENPMYDKAFGQNVDQTKLATLLLNKRLNSAFDNVVKDKDFSEDVKGLPLNNIKFIDTVKQYLDNQVEKFSENEPKRASRISNVKKQLVSLADQASPEYAIAREAAEKRLTRESIEKSINEADLSGTSFYDKWLKNDDDFDKLRFHLRDRNNPTMSTPEQKKLDSMRETFSSMLDLINKKGGKTLSEATGMQPGLKSALYNSLNNIGFGSYNKAVSDLMTNPKWDLEFKSLDSLRQKQQRASKMADMMTRAISSGIAPNIGG